MRRSFVAVALAVFAIGVSTVQAQANTAAPPAQQPAAAAPAAQAAPPDPLKFTTDDAVIIIQVTGAKAADFEAGFKAMMGKLTTSAKPDVKALGASMSLSKATVAGDNALYVLMIHGASKDLSYNWGKIIYYSGKEPGSAYDGIFEKQDDATPVYKQINDSIIVANGAQQVSVLPLTRIGG